MKKLPAGLRLYALLLLLLLVLAAVACYTTVSYLEYQPQLRQAADALHVVKLMLFSLSGGVLFLAGALGLWGMRYAAEAESRRRIGLLVDAMDYVSDGVLALGKAGRLVGVNPAARLLGAGAGPEARTIEELFPCLSAADVAVLLDKTQPREVERSLREGHAARTLRFRSEPGAGVNRVLVSDVTEQKARRLRDRQAAQLQLVGRIARGVAHDFNTILCAISGNASLLQQRGRDGTAARDALEAISNEARRGAGLARQLVDLSRSGAGGEPAAHLAEHVERAAGLLRVTLSSSWRVLVEVEDDLPAVPFTGRQVEQIVLNLGLLAADRHRAPRTLHLRLRPPGREPPWDVPRVFGAVLVLTTSEGISPPDLSFTPLAAGEGLAAGGVILSILGAMVEEAGGSIAWHRGRDGYPQFRLCFPPHDLPLDPEADQAGIPDELAPYLAGWSVLLACPEFPARDELDRRMTTLGITVERVDDLVNVLAQVEDPRRVFAGIILGRAVLRGETESLLRAVLKLQPAAGLVLLDDPGGWIPGSLREETVVVPGSSSPEAVLQGLIRAREIAGQRVHKLALS